MSDLFTQALHVAKTYDVATPADSLVLYSVSYLPSKINRDRAFAYVKAHPGAMMIEHTPCGAKLVEMGLESSDSGLKPDDLSLVWKEASRRLIRAAKGNVTAFVEGADPRSVFLSRELPELLANAAVTTINQMPKAEFAEKVFPQRK